ncbi:MAG: hypothetical protein HW380_712 [Magnetococcales bacterium]|nr:hypothetical protein [Magnetococcales bacterium]
MDNITVLGIDLAKSVFHLHGVDQQGKVVLKRLFDREKMLSFFANLPPCLIGLEGNHSVSPLFFRMKLLWGSEGRTSPRTPRKNFCRTRISPPRIHPFNYLACFSSSGR